MRIKFDIYVFITWALCRYLQLEKWIDKNVSSLPSKELEARGKQLQIMKDICAKYEEQDLDTKGNYQVKKEANIELLEMMAKVESVGGKLPPEVAAKGVCNIFRFSCFLNSVRF